MLRRVNTYLHQRALIALAIGGVLLALPALGWAASGGGGASSGAGGGSTSSGSPSGGGGVGPSGPAQTQSGNRTVTDSGHGVRFTTRASGFLRRTMTFSGSAGRSAAGKVVVIQRSGSQTGGRWVRTATATVGPNGSFSTSWRVNHVGRFAVRAVLGTKSAGGQTASTWPTVDVILYRVSVATIYGPGFWGNRTACGRRLRRSTLGVANRTLPCGTQVSLYYRGRTIQVPVIDRGPYANGANWDLTEATAHALHMEGTARVGAASVPH